MKKWIYAFIFWCICYMFCTILVDLVVVEELDKAMELAFDWLAVVLSTTGAILYLFILDKWETDKEEK